MIERLNCMLISIVVPCFNEEQVINETNKKLTALCRQWHDEKLFDAYEIVYVNDGSSDSTLELLKEIAEKDDNVKIVSFSRNYGQQSALSAGLEYASGNAVVSLDADLQDPPEVVKAMIEKFNEGYEIVYGVRDSREKDTFFKRTTSRCFYKFMKVMGVNLVYDHADFRLVSRDALNAFLEFHEVNRFVRGIFANIGFKSCIVKHNRAERFAGETKYSVKNLIELAIESITSFSVIPLRIAAGLGFAVCIISLLMSIWAIANRAAGNSVPGWASTVLPMYFFGGVQLIFLGIIGEYIG